MLLEGLETLCLLASEGTMAKVASRLYISQSAVSKRITQLEQRLGKRLIEPDGRQIRLTPQARELLARVAPSLAEMKGVLADSQTLTDKTSLPVACSETLLAGYQSRMKTVSPSDRSERRMIFFFQQHRTHGAAQAFADVES